MDTKQKPAHNPAPIDESRLDDGNFGWVWMERDGTICGVCRQKQPQSKADCIEGHPVFNSNYGGLPIPWMLQ